MNRLLLNDSIITVEGIDNAMELAKVLVKNNYQVMVQLDDMDVYVVSFVSNETWEECEFAILDQNEIDLIEDFRSDAKSDSDNNE